MMDIIQVGEAKITSMEVLNRPAPDGQQVTEFEQALSGGNGGLGVDMLNKLGQANEAFSRDKKAIIDQLSTSADNPAQLMKTQMMMMQVNLKEELIAKMVGRLTQNVETLLKTQ